VAVALTTEAEIGVVPCDTLASRIINILAIVFKTQAVGAGRPLFCTFALSVLAIDAAILRPLLCTRQFVLTGPETSAALVTCRFCLVAFDLLLSTSDACLALDWHRGWRRFSDLGLLSGC
jgi:hypothetical protein